MIHRLYQSNIPVTVYHSMCVTIIVMFVAYFVPEKGWTPGCILMPNEERVAGRLSLMICLGFLG